MKLVGIGKKQSTAASHSGTGGSRRERGQLWFVFSPSPPVWLKIHFSCSTCCKAKFQEFCCSSPRQPKTAKLAPCPQFSSLFLVNGVNRYLASSSGKIFTMRFGRTRSLAVTFFCRQTLSQFEEEGEGWYHRVEGEGEGWYHRVEEEGEGCYHRVEEE